MNSILGIDIGGSTTKIIGYRDGKMFSPILVKANDPRASLFGAFGRFMSENRLSLTDIEKVMITGVGSSEADKEIFGIETKRISEFQAIGKGGLFLSNLEKAVIVSMGTGTAFVSAKGDEIRHIGGSGVGGGTLLGLSNRILNVRHFNDLIATATNGDLRNIDLFVQDISREKIKNLPPYITASNFGKISDLATNSDLALGIINLVFQTIGVISVFAAQIVNSKHIVLTGNLTSVPQAEDIFGIIEKLYKIKFIIPEHAEYATATGAALLYNTVD